MGCGSSVVPPGQEGVSPATPAKTEAENGATGAPAAVNNAAAASADGALLLCPFYVAIGGPQLTRAALQPKKRRETVWSSLTELHPPSQMKKRAP